jgi:CheY-like chemotaxis protein
VAKALSRPARGKSKMAGPAVIKGRDPGPALRILIVEDCFDNQMLIQAYLKSSAHKITFAEDGLAALEEFNKTQFDLIFMDLQMPRMDGYTAAQQIRAMEAQRGLAAVPLVALSANARPEDLELSRKSGCDAHLSKPISKARLVAAIEEYGMKRASRDRLEAPAERHPSGIRIEPPEGLEEITGDYIACRKGEAPRLLELLNSGEFDKIRIAGHNMKGTGASYGMPVVTTLGAGIESAAKTADVAALKAKLSELAEYLDRVYV